MNAAELKNINRTPYEDTIEVAEDIWQTTKANGGGTWMHDRDGWWSYTGDGYAVGGYQDTVDVVLDLRDPVVNIARFIERIPTTGDGSKRYLLGTWVKDGVLFIDAVTVWADIENAIVEGQRLDQYSVYGFREGREFVCSEYEAVDGEVFHKETGRNILTLETIDQLIEEEVPFDPYNDGYRAALEDVIDAIEWWRAVNERNLDRYKTGEWGSPEFKDRNVRDYISFIAEDNWIIAKLQEKFGK